MRSSIHTPLAWGGVFAVASLVPAYYMRPVLSVTVSETSLPVSKYLVMWACFLAMSVQVIVGRGVGRGGGSPISMPPMWGWVLLSVLVSFASLAGAQRPALGTLKWAYYSATGPLVYLFAAAMTREQAQTLISTVVFVVGIVAVYGVVEGFAGRNYLYGTSYELYSTIYSGPSRVSSSIGNPIAVGGYLALALPLVWAQSRLHPQARWRWLFWTCLTALLLTYSRAAWVAVCVGFVATLLCGRSLLTSTVAVDRQRVLLCVLTLILASPMVGAVTGGHDAPFLGRIWTGLERAVRFQATEEYRLKQYVTTLSVLKSSPALGVGIGNLPGSIAQHRPPISTPFGSQTTDNMYLMVACEGGLVGFGVFLAMLTGLGVQLWRWFVTSTGQSRLWFLAFFAGYLSLLANMVFWDALYFPVVRLSFWLLLGLAAALAARR